MLYKLNIDILIHICLIVSVFKDALTRIRVDYVSNSIGPVAAVSRPQLFAAVVVVLVTTVVIVTVIVVIDVDIV